MSALWIGLRSGYKLSSTDTFSSSSSLITSFASESVISSSYLNTLSILRYTGFGIRAGSTFYSTIYPGGSDSDSGTDAEEGTSVYRSLILHKESYIRGIRLESF